MSQATEPYRVKEIENSTRWWMVVDDRWDNSDPQWTVATVPRHGDALFIASAFAERLRRSHQAIINDLKRRRYPL